MKTGFVALVGAGPGEVSLLTVRAKALLERAEVVLYDRLVSADILALIPPTARRVNVGKENNNHPVPQPEINALLLQYAQEGNVVVRLKGGDPYVFGRGGEELELLVEHEIPFEVVPGITSAIAASSFAGIPVTHRDFCSSFHVITGHQKKNEPLNIDFESLVRTKGTLVFLMGVSSLTAITQGLRDAGMSADMPAAVIENGTRAYQRKVVSTIAHLVEEATAQQIASPAIIIVGKVCSLSEDFDWFSKRALFGKQVIVTSPTTSDGTFVHMLKAQGAMVHSCPAVEIVPTVSEMEFAQIVHDMTAYTWLVFTSKNGVHPFFAALQTTGKDTRALGQLKVAAVGPSTAKALQQYGVVADYIPNVYQGTSLAEGLAERLTAQDKVLFLRAEQGNDALIQRVAQAGVAYTDYKIYRTQEMVQYQETIAEVTQTAKETKTPFYVCFTSASTVHAFMKHHPDTAHFVAVCIGSQTASAAQIYDLTAVVAEKATLPSMIEKLLEVAK